MLVFTQRLHSNHEVKADLTLALTAEQRSRSRQTLELPEGKILQLRLPRGTVLFEGDLLQSELQDIVAYIVAKPEPVITVKATSILSLLKAAYHLGNRHIPLEVKEDYLRFSPDSVLVTMLEKMGLNLEEETVPFYPEQGAYGHHH